MFKLLICSYVNSHDTLNRRMQNKFLKKIQGTKQRRRESLRIFKLQIGQNLNAHVCDF